MNFGFTDSVVILGAILISLSYYLINRAMRVRAAVIKAAFDASNLKMRDSLRSIHALIDSNLLNEKREKAALAKELWQATGDHKHHELWQRAEHNVSAHEKHSDTTKPA